MFKRGEPLPLPHSNSVVVVYSTKDEEYIHISFTLRRETVDLILSSVPKHEYTVTAYIYPFIIASKKDMVVP